MRRTFFVAFFCLIAGLGFAHAHTQAILTVAFSGRPAPGTPAGVTFSGFSGNFIAPRIDDGGTVYFLARLQGSGVDVFNDTGLWMQNAGGAVELVAREFDHAPGYYQGQPGGEFSDVGIVFRDFMQLTSVDPPDLKVSGKDHVLTRTDFFGYDENDEWIAGQALYQVQAGELELVAGARMPAPGISPANEFRQLQHAALNSNGNVAFSSTIFDRSIFDDTGIWTNARGELELVAIAGGQVLGMPDGVVFAGIGANLDLNSTGKLVFGGGIREPNNGSSSKDVVLAGMADALSPVVREGDRAPGTPADTTFDHFQGPLSVDGAGRVFFHGELVGPGIDEANDRGLWLEDAGSISLVAREGEQAPDMSAGVNILALQGSRFNSRGDISLYLSLTGSGIDSTNDFGIWAGKPDSLRLVVQEGDPAPGLGGDVFMQVFPVGLNESGRLAVVGDFAGTVFGGGSNRGIWAEDINGELQLIVKTGDMLELAPGDFREASLIQFGGFNDRGQVVFRASFTDLLGKTAQGIFVSDMVAVPEPASLSLAVALLALLGRPNRGRK